MTLLHGVNESVLQVFRARETATVPLSTRTKITSGRAEVGRSM